MSKKSLEPQLLKNKPRSPKTLGEIHPLTARRLKPTLKKANLKAQTQKPFNEASYLFEYNSGEIGYVN